jgi:hypothetical protein
VLAEHVVAQLAELDEELGARAGALGVDLLLIEVAGGAIPVGRVDRDHAERGERREVLRIEIERLLELLLRGHPIAQLVVELLADAVVHLDALLAVGREVGDARHVVDRFRRIPLLLVELRERLERGDVGVLDVDDVEVRVDRALGVLDLLGVDLGGRAVELDLLLAVQRRVDVAVVRVDEVVPLPQAAVAALEGLEGALVRRVDLDDLLQAGRREIRLEEVGLLVFRDLEEHVDALALRLDDVELHLEHLDELGPLREQAVDALQAAHREEVGAVDVEHLAVHLRGLLGLAERGLVEAAGAQLGGRDLLRLGERLALAGEDVDELVVEAALLVDALQRFERREVERIDVERHLVVAEALIDVARDALDDLAQLGEDLLAVRVAHRDGARGGEGLALLLPAAGLLEEVRHLPEHGHVVRVDAQDELVIRLRVLRVAEILGVPLGEAQRERDAARRLLLRLEHAVHVLDQLGPPRGRGRHSLEITTRLVVVEVHLERREERVERLALVLEVLLVDLRDLAEEDDLVLLVLARLVTVQVELDEGLGPARGGVQLLEGEERLVVRRVDLEDLLVRGRGAVLLADLVLPEAGDLEVLAHLLGRVLVGRGAAHLDLDHLHPALLGAEEVLEGGHRLEVARIDREQPAPRVDRVGRLVQRRLVDRAELAEDRDLVLGRERLLGAVDRLVEGLHDLVRVAAAPPDLRDRVERFDVAVVDVEDALVVLERGVVAPELVGVELRAAQEDGHPRLVVARDVVVALEDVAELGPLLHALVQVREGAERLRILAAQLEDALPRLDRGVDVAQAVRVEVRHLRADVGLGGVAHGDLELPVVDDLEVGPRALLRVDALQRVDRLLVRAIELVEDLAVGADGVVELAEALLVDLAQARVELDELVGLGRHADALLERARELGVLLELRVDAVEVGESALVEGLDPEHVAVRLLGLRDVGELLLEDARELLAGGRLHGLVVVEAQHVGVGVRERLPAAVGRAREALHLFERLFVVGILLERTHVHGERPVRREELLLEELRDPVVHREALLALGELGELGLEDAGELLPLARILVERLEDLADLDLLHAVREQTLERLQRGGVVGRLRDDLAVRRDRRVHVVQPELVHLAEAVLELELLVRGLRDLGLAREDLREIAPALGHGEEAIERADGRLVLGSTASTRR